MNKQKYIQDKIIYKHTEEESPKFLYKYRNFDKFTFDMLENNYLYLSRPKDFDDETECNVIVREELIQIINNKKLGWLLIQEVLLLVKPDIDKNTMELCLNECHGLVDNAGNIINCNIITVSYDLKQYIGYENSVHFVNLIGDINKFMDCSLRNGKFLYDILLSLDMREKLGICSLSTSSNNDDLWNRYASNKTGYCVEYLFEDEKYTKDLFPVIYTDDREFDIIHLLIRNYIIRYMIQLNYDVKSDFTMLYKLFLSKYKKREVQDERRIIGDYGEHFKCPKINKIIIGLNAKSENIQQMKEFCIDHDIEFILQK